MTIVFEPGDPPRAGRVTVRNLDVGEPVRMSVADALPILVTRRDTQSRTATFWREAAVEGLRLVARGRLLPAVSAGGYDAWRAGPLEPADVERIREIAAGMPAGVCPASPDRYGLLREFLDAVADVLPRTPAAVRAAGGPAFAAVEPQPVPELREWADEVAAVRDAGSRISLRAELAGVTDNTDNTDNAAESAVFRVVVQAHIGAVVIDAGELWDSGQRFEARVRLDTVLAVRRAARVWAPLEGLLGRAVPDALELDDEEVFDLLADGAMRLAAAGVEVYWPKELARDLTARAVIGAGSTIRDRHDHGEGRGGLEALFAFDWQLALGGEPLTEAEMDRLAQAHRPIVRLRDQWLLVDPGLVRKAGERDLRPLTAIDALGAALTGAAEVGGEQVEVVPAGELEELRERISQPDGGREPVGQHVALAGSLRDYQLRGLRWLARNTSLGLGGCLADDMGLGKTITLIALHLHRQTDPSTAGPTLVVCPASLLGNWDREIKRFAPGTPVRRFHGPDRSLDGVGNGGHDGFVLTTYATMRLDADRLGDVRWGLFVADEAQHVKNPLSMGAKALRAIPAAARVALTGTPVENSLSDLWAILDWTTPGLLGTWTVFRTRWATPIEVGDDRAAAERLSRLTRPFLLRRRKSDPGIAPELPAKTETDRPVALTHEQAALYEATVRETMARIRSSTGMARRGLVLKLLTACKQICNHPAQYLREERPQLSGRSGKLELLDELVNTIITEGGAVLVFSQYVAMARLIERHLAMRGVSAQLLHGGTPVRRREEMVHRFQTGVAPVFLLSLKAAGTGLNLTRADHVIHYDRWWNPAVEEQATDRAHRIGQTRPVQVHRMIAEGTVEDRIAAMLVAKRELADAVLRAEDTADTAEAALTELSDAELADLVGLRSPMDGTSIG